MFKIGATFAACVMATQISADTTPIDFSGIVVLVGYPHARDGDNLEFRPEPPQPGEGIFSVRLRGIAAPENRRGAVEPKPPDWDRLLISCREW